MQKIKECVLKNKHIFLIIAVTFVGILISCLYIGYTPALGSDATEFKLAADFLAHGGQVTSEVVMNRIIPSPLFLYTSNLLALVTHDIVFSFALINGIFYVLCVLAFYYLALEIYNDKKVAWISVFLVAFNFYLIQPGNAHLADIPGWFFLAASTCFSIRYIKTFLKKYYWLAIAFAVIGFFFKEYGGLALINLALLIFISEMPWQQKIKDVLLAALVSGIPILSYHLYTYVQYHVSYIDKFTHVKVTSPEDPTYQSKSFVLLVKNVGWVFSFGWLAFLYGVYEEWKIKSISRIKILLAIFPSTLTFILWPAITERLAVILLIWAVPVAAFGLSKVKWYVLYPFFVVYFLFNTNIQTLISKINLPF